MKRLGRIRKATALFVDKSASMQNAIEIGKRVAALVSGIMDADLFVYAFDNIAYRIETKDTSLGGWTKAFSHIRACGMTSVGAAMELLRRNAKIVEQIVIVTDEGENTAPYFVEVYRRYAREFDMSPTVVFLKVRRALNYLERMCRKHAIPFETFTFEGDYYALPNLVPLLTRPSRLDLLLEILETPLPKRRTAKSA